MGLVEQKQVRGLQHQLSDQDAGTLTAGKSAHRADLDFPGFKEKFRGPRGDVNYAFAINNRVAIGREGAAQR